MADIIIYNTKDGKATIKLYADNGTAWLTQAQIAELFNTTKQNISTHISKIFSEQELDRNSVVKYYLTTAKEGKEYAILTAEISKAAFGITPSQHKKLKDLDRPSENLRDHMIIKLQV